MEKVLGTYEKPYDSEYPVVTMDESPYQLIADKREALPVKPGLIRREDYEYERKGSCNFFLGYEPLTGHYDVSVTEHRTRLDWAYYIKHLVDDVYADARKVILVLDNLNTHNSGSFYAAFPPEEAERLMNRVEFVYTPKHASWLNMAEIGFSILKRQCLDRRIGAISLLRKEIMAWVKYRNELDKKINWQFTTKDARVKLRRLYPVISSRTEH